MSLPKSISVAAVTIFSVAFSLAQVDPEKEKDIDRLLETMGRQQIADTVTPILLRPLAEWIIEFDPSLREGGFSDAFGEKWARRQREQLRKGIIVPAFDKSFSHEEIRQLIVFWESPLGRRLAQVETEMAGRGDELEKLEAEQSAMLLGILTEMEPDFPQLESIRALIEKQVHVGGDNSQDGGHGAEVFAPGEYVNRNANLRLVLPDGWKSAAKLAKTRNSVGALTSGDGSLSLFFLREGLDGPLSDFRNGYVRTLRDAYAAELLDESQLVLDGKPAVRFFYRISSQGRQLEEMTTAIREEGWVTVIIASGEKTDFKSSKAALVRMVDSYSTLTKVVEMGGLDGQDYPKVVEVDGAVQTEKLVYQVPAVYPEQAKAAKIEGLVHLLVLIDEQGSVRLIEVLEGPAPLTKAAIEAVRQWGYAPTLVDGQPSPAITSVGVNFVMRDQ